MDLREFDYELQYQLRQHLEMIERFEHNTISDINIDTHLDRERNGITVSVRYRIRGIAYGFNTHIGIDFIEDANTERIRTIIDRFIAQINRSMISANMDVEEIMTRTWANQLRAQHDRFVMAELQTAFSTSDGSTIEEQTVTNKSFEEIMHPEIITNLHSGFQEEE